MKCQFAASLSSELYIQQYYLQSSGSTIIYGCQALLDNEGARWAYYMTEARNFIGGLNSSRGMMRILLAGNKGGSPTYSTVLLYLRAPATFRPALYFFQVVGALHSCSWTRRVIYQPYTRVLIHAAAPYGASECWDDALGVAKPGCGPIGLRSGRGMAGAWPRPRPRTGHGRSRTLVRPG